MTREKVNGDQGRRWVAGELDTDAYFADVERRARDRAVRSVALRIRAAAADGGRAARPLPAR